MGADAADALDERERLQRVPFGREFFDAAMIIADEDLGVRDFFALDVRDCVWIGSSSAG